MSRKPPQKPLSPDARPDAQHDAQLWAHVTRSVTPMHRPRRAARDGEARGKKAQDGRTPRKKESSAPAATRKTPAATPAAGPAKAPPAAGFDRSTEARLRRGQLDIEARLDLHGMTQAQAHAALARFIAAAIARERRTLLVITGKGKAGGGVLRRLLPLWLQEEPWRSQVLAATPAAPKDGGGGAFYLRLRKPRSER